jgi:3-deoxy-manno-octulosonate cytidylyltransferase (CMP-KDO synthetase)
MRIAAVIPSRYQSTRFPGKPLALIAGKTMIERVYRQVEKVNCLTDIIVATDDSRIFSEVINFGGKVEMTAAGINSGTERVWSVIKKKDFDAVINIQGDEPLISEQLIFDVFRALENNICAIVSAARFNRSYREFCSENVVKVVFDNRNQALYFSRSPIPFCGEKSFHGFYQHIGIYGYTKKKLEVFSKNEISQLEADEKLEQLRFLILRQKIHIIQTDFVSHGVDVPDDIEKIEKLLRA